MEGESIMATRGSGWLAAALVVLASVGTAAGQTPLEVAYAEVEKASLEKSAADRVYGEKIMAQRAASTLVQTLADTLTKATEAKQVAWRTGAAEAQAVAEKTMADADGQLKAVRAALDKINNEINAAAKVVQDKNNALNAANQKLAAARQPTDKTAGDVSKAAADATAARENAENVLNQKTQVASQASTAAAASQAAATQTAAEKAAADKALADKFAAIKTAIDAATASKALADKAVADKTAADQALAAKTPAAKAAADAAAAEKDAAKKAVLQKAADAAAAEKAAAEKAVAEKAAATKATTDKAAADKGALDKLIAEKPPAEKLAADKTAAAKAAADKAAAEKAAADKAIAEKTAAENDFKAKVPAERSAWYKANEARFIAQGGLKIIPENAWDYAKARHLLVRAGFGGTPDEVTKLHQMGMVNAINYLVDYQYVPAEETALRIDMPERPLPTEGMLSQQERDRLNQRRDSIRNNDFYRVRNWWMKRLVESPRPLQEKLALFWHGHFAVQWEKVAWPHMLYQQNQLFRDHAAGNFGGLLYGIVHDPAMIIYLDNQINYKHAPNQNLAREVMELFSMGVNQGYSEFDIREGARALTGYTYEHYTGQFRFSYGNHDFDQKNLFGRIGNWTGDDFVSLILEQPHTARFISAKLFDYFAYSNPDPAVVQRLATVLRANQYELAPMLKNLFMSEEFYSSKAVGTQIKGPVQLLVGLCRDFGVKNADYGTLVAWCADMGQDLLQPPNVKGWYGGRDWVNANLIFMRHNYVSALIQSVPQNNQRGLDLVAALENKGAASAAQVVEYLARCCLNVALNDEQKKELVDVLGQLPPPAEWAKQKDQLNGRLRHVLLLMLTVPQYQVS